MEIKKRKVIICFVFLAMFYVVKFGSLDSTNKIYQEIIPLQLRKLGPHESTMGKRDPQQRSRISCDRSHDNYDLCSINGQAVLDPTISTFFTMDPTTPTSYGTEKIRPYPRKWENHTMYKIIEIKIVQGPPGPICQTRHNLPALVFSAGGHTGNFFHDFNDGFVPLYVTVNSIYHDRDFILVISNARDWWLNKYGDLLRGYTKHPIVNLDNDTSTHCFTSATLGLISHGLMTINHTLIPNSKTITHFRFFLEKIFTQSHKNRNPISVFPSIRPRLVLTARRGKIGRVTLNQIEVEEIAKRIGFNVIVFEPTLTTPLHQLYSLISSSHAMVGVHGAALTHLLFLRPGSVLGQVVPLGAEWVSEVCFGIPARAVGIEYMEYKIGVEESSLVENYDRNDLLMKDPEAFVGANWSVMDVYLKEQNVRLNLVRFEEYLRVIYRKAREFMKKEG